MPDGKGPDVARLRLAVIGLGFMGSRWARAFAEHDGAELAVVSDVRPDATRHAVEQWGAEFVGDVREAASRSDIDAVAVCTPEHLHVDAAVAAIDAGKPVMVEKPLAHTTEDARAIRNRAEDRGVPVLVGHILRFEPRYAAIRRAIERGSIGTVQAIRSERIGLVSDQDILKGRTSVALYYGVHEFDLARWYAGDVTVVWAARSSGVLERHGHAVDDLYSVGVRFENHAHGTMMLGWSLPPHTPGWGLAGFTVIGENGMLRVVQGMQGFQHLGPDGLVDEDVHYSPEVHGRLRGAMAAEVDHFVQCARSEVEPLCSAADGMEAVRLSLAMEEAASKEEVVATR